MRHEENARTYFVASKVAARPHLRYTAAPNVEQKNDPDNTVIIDDGTTATAAAEEEEEEEEKNKQDDTCTEE